MTSTWLVEVVENMHLINMEDSAWEESTTKKYHPIMLRNKEGYVEDSIKSMLRGILGHHHIKWRTTLQVTSPILLRTEHLLGESSYHKMEVPQSLKS